MKRYPPSAPLRSHVTRRGALFHYYMMYLLLTSVLLTMAGTCIHTILKAERVDAEVALYLQTLLRLEGNLREDAAQATAVEGDKSTMTLSRPNEQSVVRWSLTDNVVKRETLVAGMATTSDRFVFQRGTLLEFTASEQQVTLTIYEPSATPVGTAGGELDSLAKSAQIVIVVASEKEAPAAAVTQGDAAGPVRSADSSSSAASRSAEGDPS